MLRSWDSPPADESRSRGRSHTGDAVRNRHHAGTRVAVERAADPYTLSLGRCVRERPPTFIGPGQLPYRTPANAEEHPRTDCNGGQESPRRPTTTGGCAPA